MANENSHAVPIARLFLGGGEATRNAWYVQHYMGEELRTVRLEVRDGAERTEVVTEAAGYVGCKTDQIQIEGPPWLPLQLSM